uniref:Uncharacterized protein n=1 Tax=Alexandrium andersonii TaxID=327968 RepID=A0A7S2IN31_9DINO|mmetsp:Transcript_86105/g.192504  ORF Transcript_86105/g.192504 Transcript_86105/m.192504 type:complete len:442 (+) Transcript_86105:3-1328(+)
MGRVAIAVLLSSIRASAAARAHAQAEMTQECSAEVAMPPGGESLPEWFAAKRAAAGIVPATSTGEMVDSATCTKKDVCLLMRQLDMDFYERAREGMLTDSDYNTPPTMGWHAAGNCNTMSRGYRVVPVEDAKECKREARKKGAKGDIKEIKSDSLPTGCVIVETRSTGKVVAYMNLLESQAVAGSQYEGKSRTPKRIMQLCVMDRSLSESAAAYYSPYKLKPSMEGREGHSTSCSFGMMGFLSRMGKTDSPCAKIITTKTDSRFHSAAHALQIAAQLEARGGAKFAAGAAKIRKYVEAVRQKFVLLDTIANHWCPDIWVAAKATEGATCDAPRVMSWTAEGLKLGPRQTSAKKVQSSSSSPLLDGLDELLAELGAEDVLAQDLMESGDSNEGRSDSSGKPIKIALNDASCDAFEDETLAQRLEGAPETPPDFFQEAFVSED